MFCENSLWKSEKKEKHTHKMIVEKRKLLQILKPASVFVFVISTFAPDLSF